MVLRSGEISIEVIGCRQHYGQLCRGMKIPCQLEFNCSNKLQTKCLKELLANRIQVLNLKIRTDITFRSHHFYWKQWSTTGFNIHWRFAVQFMTPTSHLGQQLIHMGGISFSLTHFCGWIGGAGLLNLCFRVHSVKLVISQTLNFVLACHLCYYPNRNCKLWNVYPPCWTLWCP